MIPFTPDERRAQFAPSQNVGGAVDRDVLDIIGAQPQPTMASQVSSDVPKIAPVDPDVVDIVNQSQVPLMSSLMGASRVNPDQAAEAKRLGSQIGIGQDIALRNMDEVRQRAFMAEVQRRDIARANPVLAGFLTDRTFANEASDDIGTLENVGSFFKDVAQAIAGRPYAMEYIPGELARGYVLGQRTAERGEIGTQVILGDLDETNFARAKEIQEELRGLTGGGILAATAEVVAQNLAQAREIGGAGLVGGAAGSVIPGIGTMAGFGGGVTTGIVLTTAKMEAGNLYFDLREQGVNHETAVEIAVAAGLVNGVIEAVGMKIAAAPFRQLANRIMREQIAEAVRKPTMRAALAAAGKAYVVQVGSEATEEGLQEIVNIAGEEIAKAADGIDSETTLRDASKRVLDSFVQGAMGSAILGGIGPGANLYVDMRRAGKAQRQTQFFTDLSKNATESKLKARDPGAYERFVAATAAGTNAETVFVDGATMRDVLTQAGVTDAQLEAIVPGVAQQVRQAAELGNDVTLPTAQFAGRLAGTPLGDALLPHMRLSPDAMSAMEAQQFAQNREALVEEARALLEAKTEAESAFVQEADQVLSSMRERLVAAGRDPALADIEALMHQAFVVTQAANRGMTPAQFEAESGLREIVGVPQVGVTAAPVPELAPGVQAVPRPAGMSNVAYERLLLDQFAAPALPREASDTLTPQVAAAESAVDALEVDEKQKRLIKSNLARIKSAIAQNNVVELANALYGLRRRIARLTLTELLDLSASIQQRLSEIGITIEEPQVGAEHREELRVERIAILPNKDPQQVFDRITAVLSPVVYRNGQVISRGQVSVEAGADQFQEQREELSLLDEQRTKEQQAALNARVREIAAAPQVGAPLEQAAVLEQAPVTPGFYSALEREVGAIDAKALTAQAWGERFKGLISKGAIKADELEWSGLSDYLKMQEGKVSKDAVLEFLRGNGVQVEVETLGDLKKAADQAAINGSFVAEEQLRESDDGLSPEVEAAFDTYRTLIETDANQEAIAEQRFIISDALEGAFGTNLDYYIESEYEARPETKYEKYTLPGGTNYREVLLTLPISAPARTAQQDRYNRLVAAGVPLFQAQEMAMETGEELQARIFALQKEAEPLLARVDGLANVIATYTEFSSITITNWLLDHPVKEQWQPQIEMWMSGMADDAKQWIANRGYLESLEQWQNINLQIRELRAAKRMREFEARGYESSHWSQRNVLVHLRMNDRVDADGKRVLFVEEVQSDWGQAGVKYGFANQRAADEAELADLLAQQETNPTDARKKQIARVRGRIRRGTYNVFRAPYVETTDGWLNLGLKQVLLEAVRGNYDRVAFVDGQQSKDRYDLSQQVNLLKWTDRVEAGAEQDLKLVTVYPTEGNALNLQVDDKGVVVSGGGQYDGKELDEIVPKEIAEQIMGSSNGELAGDQLKIGGEGMVAFYDKIVPAAMGKLLKKYGGGKMGEVALANMKQAELEADAERMGMTVEDVLDVAKPSEYEQNQPGFDITAELTAKLETGLPLFQAAARGPARGGYDPARLKILLGPDADFTTGAHELTHFYVDYYTKQALAGTATPQMLADLDTMFKFMGVAGDTPEARLAAFNAMPFETARPLIESITYNAEVYLFEGKAPSLELAGVFDRMLAFFRRAYKSIADFVTQQQEIYRREFGRELPGLNDDLRAVFDRMLADERQIKQAQAVAQMRGQFAVKPEGMSDAEWASYQEMAGEATNEAIRDMTKASLRQMEWLSRARNRIIKELQARHTAQRKEVRERVQKEVQQEPLYRAMAFLRRGQVVAPDGTVTEAEGVHRIDRVLAAEFAPTVDLAALGGRYGVLQDDGLHPDVVAEMFGYPTGGTLLEALAAAQPMRKAVEDRTDAEMLRLYGEMNTPEAREQEIQKALHNEARARLVGVELRFMGKIQQPVRVLMEAARQAAQQVIDRKRVGELRPSEFVAAEAKAAREATAAMQDNKPDVAVRAKRAQLLNNQLARAALEVKDEIDEALKDFRKFFRTDSKISESRDLAMVMAARSILASRGIGQSDKAPSAYIEQLKANNPGVYAELEPIITQAGVGDYRQMTVAEFRVLAESVNALWTRARRDRQIQVEDRKIALDTVITELKEALSKINRPEVQPGVSKAVGPADVAKRRLMEIRAAMRRTESWSDAVDGSDPKRPFTTYLWQPVRDATTRFRQIRNDKIKILDGLVRKLVIPTTRIAAPELGYTFGAGNGGLGKAELLGAMLHTGNISNYRKLLLGRGWASMDDAGNMNDANWRRFVARMISEGILTKEDFDFLQAVWDLNEDIKPLLQKTHYDLEGYYFKEVAATPVVTPFGTYRGGYVPAAADKFMVADAAQKAGMEELERDWRFSLPSTGMGMTKARVESYLRPLALDVRQTVAHVDAALRFAIIQPAISDALKILKNRSFAAELNAIDPTAISDMLLPWLNNAAHQTVSQPGRSRLMDAFWTGVRTRTGMSIMFSNFVNALQQVVGYFPAALKVKPIYLKNAMVTYLGAPRETASMIAAADPFMDQRMRDQVYEMQERMNDLLINPSKYAKIKAWNKQHAYFLQTAFQNQVDIVVWLGAYNQSLAESGVGVAEDKARKQAIRDAGAAVRLTQGSILPEDISAFESGTPFYRTFTQFSGYFNGIANLNATEFIKTVRAMGFRGGKGKLLYIYMLGVMMPAILSDAIVRTMRGGWEDDDDDGYLDVYMDWFFGSQLRMVAAFVPFGASAYRLVAAPFTTEAYDDRMTSSPSVSALEAATVGTGKAIINVFDEEKEVTGKNVRDVLTAISLATGIPVSAAGKPIGYLVDVARGKIEPEGPVDFVRGLVTGTATPNSRR